MALAGSVSERAADTFVGGPADPPTGPDGVAAPPALALLLAKGRPRRPSLSMAWTR